MEYTVTQRCTQKEIKINASSGRGAKAAATRQCMIFKGEPIEIEAPSGKHYVKWGDRRWRESTPSDVFYTLMGA